MCLCRKQHQTPKGEVPEGKQSRWGSRTLKALLSSLGRGKGQVRHGRKLPEGFTSAAGHMPPLSRPSVHHILGLVSMDVRADLPVLPGW